MPIVECDNCGEDIKKVSARIKSTKHHFCDKDCYSEWKRPENALDNYKDKDWLEEQYIEENKSGLDIAEKCNVTKGTIYRWLKKFGIKVRSDYGSHRARKWRNSVDWNQKQRDVVYGSLLGDGYITKSGTFELETKEKEFAQLIYNSLPKELFQSKQPVEYRYWRVYTIVQEWFKELRNDWYIDGKKLLIPKDMELTPTILLHWYLGDGHFSKHRDAPVLTSIFVNTGVATKKLRELGFEVSQYGPYGKVYKILIKDKEKYFEYIGGCPISCYDYKWKKNSVASHSS